MSMPDHLHISTNIPPEHAGRRLDQVLAAMFPDYSRARIQEWIKSGQVWLDEATCNVKQKVRGGESVRIDARLEIVQTDQAQAMELQVLYEDAGMIVLNKPAGLVVHPAAGHADRTLLNGLLYRYPELQHLPRAGIIHRLDKDTSGLMVIARTISAHNYLIIKMQNREIQRHYVALVHGEMVGGGRIEASIGRHATERTRMAVRDDGKNAVTHYRIRQRFRGFTLLDVQLETGRTHQIRVHMSHIGYPIVGDPLYRGRLRWPKACPENVVDSLHAFKRQALHAIAIELQPPGMAETMRWEQPIPEDMHKLIELLVQAMPSDMNAK